MALELTNTPGRREQIFLEASRLFVEKGFAATSMNDIASAVGITKAGIYHFVENKEDLLFTLMTFGMDELDRDVTDLAVQVADPLERLKLIVRNHLLNIGKVITETGNPLTIIIDEPVGLTDEHRTNMEGRKRAYFLLVRDTMAALKADGRLHDLDPSLAAFSVLGMIVWLARWRRQDGPLSMEDVADQMTGIALRGVVRAEAL